MERHPRGILFDGKVLFESELIWSLASVLRHEQHEVTARENHEETAERAAIARVVALEVAERKRLARLAAGVVEDESDRLPVKRRVEGLLQTGGYKFVFFQNDEIREAVRLHDERGLERRYAGVMRPEAREFFGNYLASLEPTLLHPEQ